MLGVGDGLDCYLLSLLAGCPLPSPDTPSDDTRGSNEPAPAEPCSERPGSGLLRSPEKKHQDRDITGKTSGH